MSSRGGHVHCHSKAHEAIREPGNQLHGAPEISPRVRGQGGRYEAWLGHWKPEYDRMLAGGKIEELMMQVKGDWVF